MANPFTKIRSLVVNEAPGFRQLVVASPTGDVMVIWAKNPPFGSTDLRLQIFDANGAEVSPEIDFATTRPPIWLADGSFALLFSASQSPTPINHVSHYSRAGTLLGGSPNLGFPTEASDQIFQLNNGNIVVTSTIHNGGGTTIFGRFLDSSLQPFGSSFEIVTNAPNQVHRYEALVGGGFLDFTITGSAAFGSTPRAQVFAADGTKIGAPIIMGDELMNATVLPDGGFVLTSSRYGADGSDYGIVGRVFNADGTPRTGEFVVNTTSAGAQAYSNVTAIDDDLFVITWGPTGEYAQLFDRDGHRIGSEILLDVDAGNGGWRFGGFGWSIDAPGGSGFVTGAGGIELSYWDLDYDNILLGSPNGESFDGAGATDRIMVGYGGDDTFHVDSAGDEVNEFAGQGNDTLIASFGFALSDSQSIETLRIADDAGTGAFNLTGNALAQTIRGNAGSNIIDGGGGADTMAGLGGNDFYYVDDAGDAVHEAVGGGFDRIFASVSYTLTAGSEVEMLTTISNPDTAPINLTGNERAQGIYGNFGGNTLNGGGGADALVGFRGDDNYVIVDGREAIYESADEGSDRIFAHVDYRLQAGASVEIISTDLHVGTAAIDIIGNEIAQLIYGNAGDNQLTGGGGGDTLVGFGGNDWYFVGDARDSVNEAAAGGTDRVFASVSYTLTAGSEVELLTTDFNPGTAAINLTGNALAQAIYGNAGANQLNGGGGADSLIGFGGDDWYFIVGGQENVFESASGGSDRISAGVDYRLQAGAEVELITTDFNAGTAGIDLTGNELSQALYGNAGANILDGGAGKDVLIGNGGADIFLFSTALNTAPGTAFAALAATANVDQINGFAFDDKIGLDAARFGLTPGALAPGAFVLGTAAADTDDRIIYDSATGALLFDADGSGAGAAQLFAYLSGPFSLDATYFAVI